MVSRIANMERRRAQGFTLIEMIVTMVVLTIAITAVFGVFNLGVVKSVDPMVRVQAVAIAQGYLEEILLKAYNDPGGPPEGSRADYDDVQDYNGLTDVGARDQFDNPLPELSQYTVSVAVAGTTLGSGGLTEPARQVTVSVSHPYAGGVITMIAYKTNY